MTYTLFPHPPYYFVTLSKLTEIRFFFNHPPTFSDNVTLYHVFFFDGVPNETKSTVHNCLNLRKTNISYFTVIVTNACVYPISFFIPWSIIDKGAKSCKGTLTISCYIIDMIKGVPIKQFK